MKKVGEILNKKFKLVTASFVIKIIHGIMIKLNKWTDKIFNKIVVPQQVNYKLNMQQIYSHVQLILRYELLDKTISDKDSMDVLNTAFYNNYNGIILLRACNRTFLEKVLQDSFNEETEYDLNCAEMSDEELLSFMSEVYCRDVNIVELNDGILKCYLVDYNAEVEKIEGEEYYYDIFRRKGKS